MWNSSRDPEMQIELKMIVGMHLLPQVSRVRRVRVEARQSAPLTLACWRSNTWMALETA
jgi:hypothetical protein